MDSNQSDRRRFLKTSCAGRGRAPLASAPAHNGRPKRNRPGRKRSGAAGSGRARPSRAAAPRGPIQPRSHDALHAAAGLCGNHHAGAGSTSCSSTPRSFPRSMRTEHRLTIHGLVDRPLVSRMDDLKQLPSVSRIHFVECHGNSSPNDPRLRTIRTWDCRSSSSTAWPATANGAGVPLSVLLNEAGVKKRRDLAGFGRRRTPGKFSHTLPLGKGAWTTASWPTARMAIRCASSRVSRSGCWSPAGKARST